jgi:hypothetical protein
MSRAPLDIKDLPGELARREKEVKRAIARGIRNGTRRGRAVLVMRTPKDTGLLKASWRDSTVGSGARGVVTEIFNTAPYAGIVEEGARPHAVSAEGRQAILEWARRHFPGKTEQELEGITFAICRKLREHGQEPTYFIRNARPELARVMVEEIVRAVQKVADEPRART